MTSNRGSLASSIDTLVPGFLDEFGDWAADHAPLDLSHPEHGFLETCVRCKAEEPNPQLSLDGMAS